MEESRLLKDEPSAKVLITAVCQATNEMRNIVIGRFFAIVACSLSNESILRIVETFNIKLVLFSEFVDLQGKLLAVRVFVRIVQELDFLQDLKTTDSNLLELVDPNDLMRRLVVH